MKASTCAINPGDDIWMPSLEHGNTLDWEVELAVVIGKKCRNVTPADALKYVAGYTVLLNSFWLVVVSVSRPMC